MKGFIFDLDGTLVDTAIDMLAALKALAAENNIDVEPDYYKYKELITYGSKAIVTSIFGDLDNKKFKKLQNRYLEIYQNNLSIDSKLFNGIDNFIKHLDSNDIPWGVVTNKPTNLATPLIKSLSQLKNCKIIIGGGCTKNPKPHPEPIIKALKAMAINPETSWYIGDAITDIQAANAANMNSAVAGWGYLRKQDEPENWYANIVLEKTIELFDL